MVPAMPLAVRPAVLLDKGRGEVSEIGGSVSVGTPVLAGASTDVVVGEAGTVRVDMVGNALSAEAAPAATAVGTTAGDDEESAAVVDASVIKGKKDMDNRAEFW